MLSDTEYGSIGTLQLTLKLVSSKITNEECAKGFSNKYF